MVSTKQYAPEEIAQILQEYITQEFTYDRPELVVTNDFKLIEERLIDSLAIFRLMAFMEKRFGIGWESDELVLANFETIDHMTACLLAKLAS